MEVLEGKILAAKIYALEAEILAAKIWTVFWSESWCKNI